MNRKLMKFTTYEDLIQEAEARGRVKIQEKVFLRLYENEEEIQLPITGVFLVLPSENYIQSFISGSSYEFMKRVFAWSVPETMKIPENLESKEFYYWPLLLGYDESHHGFSVWSAMLIEAGFLDGIRGSKIEENKFLSDFLKIIDEMPVPQTSDRPIRQHSLEEKIIYASDYE